ncbi:MAG: bifunctional folylpolyglutamate synthase/dihydrofolate synthase [Candidatus Margulisbacteria bacterium]|jgi:dihydrofolate synthase/folylpolyglutamate synthase|nr:bifunctional folylpolyglutamate synthase/dihydrofolate synthase [Candidatus Margulisiibacteriota bacterium]
MPALKISYAQAVRRLETYVRSAGVKPGLARIAALLRLLGAPQDTLPVIHIAGTNGKGSVALMTTNALRECDYRTGTYLSPHLVDYTERLLLNGREISRRAFAALFARVDRAARQITGVTEFEVLTAMAFVYFRENKVEIAVLETGLGGLYDATNVCRSILAIITPISYDHEDLLGKTLSAIAREKAGIIKPGVPVACAAQEPAALAEILRQAEKQENEIKIVGSPLRFKLNLYGRHQACNAALALEAMRLLLTKNFYIPRRLILNGIQKTVVPARVQKWRDNPPFFLDSGHNPQALQNLLNALETEYPCKPVVLVFGLLRRKNLSAALAILKPRVELLIAVDLPAADAYSSEEIAAAAGTAGLAVSTAPDIISACALARREAKKRSAVAAAAGSFRLTGAIFRKYKLSRNISEV